MEYEINDFVRVKLPLDHGAPCHDAKIIGRKPAPESWPDSCGPWEYEAETLDEGVRFTNISARYLEPLRPQTAELERLGS